MKPLILVIDDEVQYRNLYAVTLKKAGFEIKTAASAEDAAGIIEEHPPAMVISDVRMPGMDGISFLQKVKGKHPELPFLLITAFADIRDAVHALKLGAVDYLEKPVDLDELVSAVSDTLGVVFEDPDKDALPAESISDIVAVSPVIRSMLKDAYRVARSEATVLITGESGSGKEVIARFIHRNSGRAEKPFIAVNCAAIPGNMLASELFGHSKGAFTGAVSNRNGRFREAAGGTLFLDEIGDLPLELQPSLLRAIETGKITPLGCDREESVNTRLIAATNKVLTGEVEAGRFREDLYYRLNVIAFEVPPLRERQEDIIPLAKHFLARKQGSSKRFSPSTSEMINAYSWPGNARELSNAMERAAILSNTEIILPEHLPVTMQKKSVEDNSQASVKTIQEMESEAIVKALKQTSGNRTRAAELLGISRRALIYKLKRINLEE
jgi:DNA-binding NtrC family response regulator